MIFFQKNLSRLRAEKSMTLSQIARDLNFSSSQWSNYEQGISFPKFLDLIKISKYFNISESDLIHTDLEYRNLIETNQDINTRNQEIINTELVITQKKLIQILEEKIETLRQELEELSNKQKAL